MKDSVKFSYHGLYHGFRAVIFDQSIKAIECLENKKERFISLNITIQQWITVCLYTWIETKMLNVFI